MKIKMSFVLVSIFSLGLYLSFIDFCYAVSSGGLGIYPNKSEWNPKNEASKSWFVYNLKPGEIKKSKVDIKNESAQPVLLSIYPVDAVTTKDGSFAPQSEDSLKKNVRTWINISTQEISLNPNETKTVDFIINVPSNIDVGDHMGAIIIQNKNRPGTKIGTSMQVVNRLGARIYITVPGKKIEELEIEKFNNTMENDKVVFQLTLINKGNVRIVPKGKIEIKNEFGEIIDEIGLTQREVFPNDTIILPIKWNQTHSGNFSVLATVEYSNQKLNKQFNLKIEETEKQREDNRNQKNILGVQDTKKKIENIPIMGSILITILILLSLLRFL